MAAIRCAAAGIALLRRAAAGGERAALQKIFPSLRPRGIHSLLDRPLGTGALSSPTTSMGPARCVFPYNRYMSTSRLQVINFLVSNVSLINLYPKYICVCLCKVQYI